MTHFFSNKFVFFFIFHFRYRWIKNGKNFDWQVYDDRMSQQPGRGTIVITRPRDEDLGQYQCFAENEHGIATTNSVFVRKAELNTFKDERAKTVTANEGDPFKLQCQPPDGWPKPKVRNSTKLFHLFRIQLNFFLLTFLLKWHLQ